MVLEDALQVLKNPEAEVFPTRRSSSISISVWIQADRSSYPLAPWCSRTAPVARSAFAVLQKTTTGQIAEDAGAELRVGGADPVQKIQEGRLDSILSSQPPMK